MGRSDEQLSYNVAVMSLFDLDPMQLTGRSRTHVVAVENPACILHREVVIPFQRLRAAAADAGIALLPVSSFRDFERQLQIWNAKARGERPLYDRYGKRIDYAMLPPCDRVETILLWSALPGASRHHWGSDFDVVDGNVLTPDAPAPLLPHEYAPGGRFARLEAWLAASAADFGFHRPYARDLGGVQPEPWHLSYAAVAEPALERLTAEVLREAIERSDIEDREAVLARLPAIHQRYVRNVERPDARVQYAAALKDPSTPS
jgi:LAS superfamily LD-carboxypeptidase LdcB